MGFYLNPNDILDIYKRETNKAYFVDKTEMLRDLIPLVEQQGSCISVTRPRRFGKSVIAAMIGSFFGKGIDGEEVFSHLNIAKKDDYKTHLNKHNLIYIDFSKAVEECESYEQYIKTIKTRLISDLRETYPKAKIDDTDSVGAALRVVSLAYNNEKFILVFDEWDYVFHKKYFTETDRSKYTSFLGGMTKGMSYVELAYLTGVLPIKKYSASDTMNHFTEFNMVDNGMYSMYFGFTEQEVDELYRRYKKNWSNPTFSREDLTRWYDGYHLDDGTSMYNPNSVVLALTQNRLKDYWARSGEYNELKDYVLNNTDGVREAIMLLAAGEPVETDISEYASTAPKLEHRDEILSVMTVYGYLNYYDGSVHIPNRELQLEFDRIIKEEPRYNYMRELEKESEKILRATLEADEEAVANGLAFVHTTESPLKAYSNEAELSGSVKLAYIAARNKYDCQREDQAGIGYADYIFYPYNKVDDGIIIELKVDDTPENALKQIKEKNYALKFSGKMGEQPKTTEKIILVGIAYHREDKKHECRIEVLESLA